MDKKVKTTHPGPVIDLTIDSKRQRTIEGSATALNQIWHSPSDSLLPKTSPVCQNKDPHPIIVTLDSILQAASLGNARALGEALDDYTRTLTSVAVAAAANGHIKCVEVIRDQVYGDVEKGYIDDVGKEVLKAAVAPAAANGHINIVRYLMDDGEVNEDGAWPALIAGAANGQLDVVEFAAKEVPVGDPTFHNNATRAVLNAVSGGFVDVVAFLLTLEDWEQDAGKVFEIAMAKGQHEVAEKVYEVYPQVKPERNLFIDMAERGNVEAIKYLHDNGHRDLSLLEEARRCAVLYQHTAVVKFLELVLSESIAPAF